MQSALSLAFLLLYICASTADTLLDIVRHGAQLHQSGKLDEALQEYNKVLAVSPQNSDALNLAGVVAHQRGDYPKAVDLFRKASTSSPTRHDIWSNLAEALRLKGDNTSLEEAVAASKTAILLDSTQSSSWYNHALSLSSSGRKSEAFHAFYEASRLSNANYFVIENMILLLQHLPLFEAAKYFDIEEFQYVESKLLTHQDLEWSSEQFASLCLRMGSVLQKAGALSRAEILYGTGLEVVQVRNDAIINHDTLELVISLQTNIGAIHQARGQFSEAISYYQQALSRNPDNAGVLNNLGACQWHLGYQDLGIDSYQRALKLNPDHVAALVNLGTSYFELGDIDNAVGYYERTLEIDPSLAGIRVRIATILRPVMRSLSAIQTDRLYMIEAIRNLTSLSRLEAPPFPMEISNPITEAERLHFYFVYHGWNEYENQVAMRKLYSNMASRSLHYTSPHLRVKNDTIHQELVNENHTISIGFISKFWHSNHPHGQLLQGIIRHLASTGRFKIVIVSIPNPAGGVSAPIQEIVADHGGTIVTIGSSLSESQAEIGKTMLDVLVFVDTMSEPVNYFLGFSRLASVQVAFWGNPLTTGLEDTMDYFISSEYMESDIAAKEHYSEQLVLLDGTGIWYDQPNIPSTAKWYTVLDETLPVTSTESLVRIASNKAALLANAFPGETWVENVKVVYMVAQSVFKLHPSFDTAVKDILIQVQQSHVVFLQGRQKGWTNDLIERLKDCLGVELYNERVHFHPRVKGEQAYFNLLAMADVVLHPFPFGGSKTSADVLALGIPLVVMRGEYLRGRMAYAFYRRIGCGLDGETTFETIQCTKTALPTFNPTDLSLVAHNANQYVKTAVKFGRSPSLRALVSSILRLRVTDIFEDRQVAKSWESFLSRAVESVKGLPSRNSPDNQSISLSQLESVKHVVEPNHGYNVMDAGQWEKSNSLKGNLEETNRSNVQNGNLEETNRNNLQITNLKETNRNNLQNGNLKETNRNNLISVNNKEDDPLANTKRDALHEIYNVYTSGDLMLTKALLERAIVSWPTDASLRNDYAATLQQLGDLKAAETQFNAALQIRPDYPTAWNNLGVTLQSLNRYEEAIAAYKKAWNPTSDWEQPVYNLGNALRASGKLNEVVQFYSTMFGLQKLNMNLLSLVVMLVSTWFCDASQLLDQNSAKLYALNQETKCERCSYSEHTHLEQVFDSGLWFMEERNYIAQSPWPLEYEIPGTTDDVVHCDCTMVETVARLRKSFKHSSNNLVQLLDTSIASQALKVISVQLQKHVSSRHQAHAEPHHQVKVVQLPSIHLVTQYYLTSEPARQTELALCLLNNLANGHFMKIHLLTESIISTDVLKLQLYKATTDPRNRMTGLKTVSIKYLDALLDEKLVQVAIGKRLEFRHGIEYANENLDGMLCVLSNADVFFDDTVHLLAGNTSPLVHELTVAALLRWEHNSFQVPTLAFRTDSQDAWAFQAPLILKSPELASFELGRPRCDNRIARVLRDSGFNVVNPAWDVMVHHVHASNKRKHVLTDNVLGENENVDVLLPGWFSTDRC